MKIKLLVLILALQAVWILGTTFQQERVLRFGKAIMLETERIDPRDLLRGDYLILNYKISSIPAEKFSPVLDVDLPLGTDLFIAVAPGKNQFYEVVRASTNELSPAAGEILLVGRSAGRRWNTANTVQVEYGLERYYVAEGNGNPTGKLTVEAVVPRSGHASIKQVFVNDRPYAEAMRDKATANGSN